MEEAVEKSVREKVENACQAVQLQNISIRAAGRQFGISSTTIHRHLRNPNIKAVGKPSKFNTAECNAIADLLLRFADVGGTLSRNLVRRVVLAVGQAKGLSEASNKFSTHWQRQFLSRYPAVAARFSRKKARDWNVEKWNDLMEELERDGQISNPRTLFAFSEEETIPPNVKNDTEKGGVAKVTTPKQATPRLSKDRFALHKKKMFDSLKEIWGDELAEADIGRLVAEADFMARGVIPSVKYIDTTPKPSPVLTT